jgi:crotonobetainyl-CoA:carnitine CoA-transferase CaiB-like acyl-CoA transferase
MRKPLDGCRVIDFGIITAGAATSAVLADLGADVIKVESPTYRDPFRAWLGGMSLAGGTDCPPLFRSNNRGKRGISIDLKQPAGRDALLRLVAKSDVVLENFRRGVLARLGLDVTALRQANPELIVLSISGQGGVGPDAAQVSYGSTLEAVGGLAWLTGYPGGAPVVSGRELNYPDQVVALFAAGAVLAAWLGRQRGEAGGAVIDVSQRELTSFLVGEAFLAAEAAGARGGNAAAEYALQGCYPSGDGRWVALSVAPDELPALARLLGVAEAGVPAALAAWLRGADAAGRVALLKATGIAAAVVQGGADLATSATPAWDHAFGTTPEGALIKAMPFRIDGLPFAVSRDAPAVGEHTHAVLAELAGYDDDTLQTLTVSGVIEGP